MVLIIAAARLLIPTRHYHSVYPNYGEAASRWVHGESVYTITRDYNYRYSPIVTVIFAAFLPLGDRVAGAIWCLIDGMALIGATWLWMRRAAPRAISPSARGIVLLLMLPLSIGNIAIVQVNPLVIAMLLLAMVAFDLRRWTMAAALIAGAFFFKIYPLALGMLLILTSPAADVVPGGSRDHCGNLASLSLSTSPLRERAISRLAALPDGGRPRLD